MDHLIADTGIQFLTREIEFNPNEPLVMPGGRTLRYSFYETVDIFEETKQFGLLYYNSDESKYVPLDELYANQHMLARTSTGREVIDPTGMPQMLPGTKTTMLSTYDDGDPDVYTMNTLQSLRVPDPDHPAAKVPAYRLLVDKWLPMPMFQCEVDGLTGSMPLGWCRMKMQRMGEGSHKGTERFRLVWAFDTALAADELSVLRPYIDADSATFAMCNKADCLMPFVAHTDDFHAFADYIASLLGIADTTETDRYRAYYIYFVNFIRLAGGAPDVVLHRSKQDIDVDLVLDIGNSRTCGVLFEQGDFTRSQMLALRDLSQPSKLYENRSFDMRVVFRKADFGNDIVLDEPMFAWQSFVRVGEEARRLVYRSLEEEGLADKTTNYSSPKRYLWDTKPYSGQWENLVTTDDPFNVLLSNSISVPVLSRHFDDDGTFLDQPKSLLASLGQGGKTHHYSRASLMTFAMIEIFQHAVAQINSTAFRDKWGNKDCMRRLRNVIVTCPTAMPLVEQKRLRQSAADAFAAMAKGNAALRMPQILPAPAQLKPVDCHTWTYDEASCCQLVYLCAEIAQRYRGEAAKFFDTKGHVRPELAQQGYDRKALTIGSIDIGAGTTDIMVCSYQYEGDGQSRITPTPLFWDSFYLAGDDILRAIIQTFVIEGPGTMRPGTGSISSALQARIQAMTDDELTALPCTDNIVYRAKVADICSTIQPDDKQRKKADFVSVLIRDFFGTNSAMMGYVDRRCRNDFNTQISMPIAQLFMEKLRTHRPAKMLAFDDIFADTRPADYLLDHFAHHFGFRLEELHWHFDPIKVAGVVKATMEPLLKQLALVLYTQHCDIVVLAGRPTSIDAITELFIKHLPTSPDRLVRLNDYNVGNWFPTADGQGYFYDQKSVVAVGAMVGYVASTTGLRGLAIDFGRMAAAMKSTANYVGVYKSGRRQVQDALLTPELSVATLDAAVFPEYIGCRQLDSPIYQARPLYAIYNHSGHNSLRIMLSRSFYDDRELISIEEVTDSEGNTLPKKSVEIVEQSLVDNGHYWLDSGEFELTR